MLRYGYSFILCNFLMSGLLLSPLQLCRAEEQTVIFGLKTSGEIEAGGRVFSDQPSTSEQSKFEEYRDIYSGAFLEKFLLQLENNDGTYLLEFEANKVGDDDQNFFLGSIQTGRYKFELEWDQTPHLYSNTGQSLFSYAGNGILVIPDDVQSILEAASTPLDTDTIGTAINANLSDINLRIQRDTGSIEYRYTPTTEWDLRLHFDVESREGSRPFAGNISTSTTSSFNTIELVEPIDYLTYDLKTSAEYATDDWSLMLSYTGSIFDNEIKSVIWDNPFRTSDSETLGSARGQHALPPDNIEHKFALTGAVNLPFRSRFMGSIAYNTMRQDDDFQPMTINSLLVSSPLPANDADAKIDTLLMDFVFNTRLPRNVALTARYRHYSIDNDTPELLFPDYVRADSTLVKTPRRSLAIEYSQQVVSLHLGFRPISPLSLNLNFDWEEFDRYRRAVNFTDEYTTKLDTVFTPTDWLLLRASYLQARRRYDEYDQNKFVGIESDPVNGSLQSPLLRKFSMADRDRERTDFLVELSPLDTLNFTITFDRVEDDYSNIGLGVTGNDQWNAGFDVFYTPNRDLSLFVNYSHEEFEWAMHLQQRSTLDDSSLNFWHSKTKDSINTVGAGLEARLIQDRLDLKLEYSYSDATGETETFSHGDPTVEGFLPITAVDYPDTKDSLHTLYIDLNYQVSERYSVKLSFIYEQYRETDFATDVMKPYMVDVDPAASRSIFLGVRDPDYTAKIFSLSLNAKF